MILVIQQDLVGSAYSFSFALSAWNHGTHFVASWELRAAGRVTGNSLVQLARMATSDAFHQKLLLLFEA